MVTDCPGQAIEGTLVGIPPHIASPQINIPRAHAGSIHGEPEPLFTFAQGCFPFLGLLCALV